MKQPSPKFPLLCCLILLGCGSDGSADSATASASTDVQTVAPTPPCPVKVDTLTVCKDGLCMAMGQHVFGFDPGGAGLNYAGGGPVNVYVFRSFSESPAEVERAGLSIGKAFTRPAGGKWTYLCDVDPALTDEQLRAKFGIEDPAASAPDEAASTSATN